MPKLYITNEWRQIIATRANHCCEYCKTPSQYTIQPFVMEHIIPISRDGKTVLENLAYACGGCNGHKYNKIDAPNPVDQKNVPLFNPREESWQSHFAWSEDYSLMIGITPSGRATLEALQLNRIGLINMRKLLIAVGKHPPNRL